MVKTAEDDGPAPTFTDYSILEGKSAGHKNFNKRVSETITAELMTVCGGIQGEKIDRRTHARASARMIKFETVNNPVFHHQY